MKPMNVSLKQSLTWSQCYKSLIIVPPSQRKGYLNSVPSQYWYHIKTQISVTHLGHVNHFYSIQFCFIILENHFTFLAIVGGLIHRLGHEGARSFKVQTLQRAKWDEVYDVVKYVFTSECVKTEKQRCSALSEKWKKES